MRSISELLASDAADAATQASAVADRALALLGRLGVEARLIGSLARGDFLPHSDIDLLVLACPDHLRYAIEGQLGEVLEGWPFHVVYLDEIAPVRQAKLLREAEHAPRLR